MQGRHLWSARALSGNSFRFSSDRQGNGTRLGAERRHQYLIAVADALSDKRCRRGTAENTVAAYPVGRSGARNGPKPTHDPAGAHAEAGAPEIVATTQDRS